MMQTIFEHAKRYAINIEPQLTITLQKVEREAFGGTLQDRPEPIGFGQTISQPFMVAAMSQIILNHTPKRLHIIEIGTGSGYQAAILSHHFHTVTSFERLYPLANRAFTTLKPYTNVRVIPKNAQFIDASLPKANALIATCGVTGEIPIDWFKALEEDGILLLPYQTHNTSPMELVYFKKNSGHWQKKSATQPPLYCKFVPFVRPDDPS